MEYTNGAVVQDVCCGFAPSVLSTCPGVPVVFGSQIVNGVPAAVSTPMAALPETLPMNCRMPYVSTAPSVGLPSNHLVVTQSHRPRSDGVWFVAAAPVTSVL